MNEPTLSRGISQDEFSAAARSLTFGSRTASTDDKLAAIEVLTRDLRRSDVVELLGASLADFGGAHELPVNNALAQALASDDIRPFDQGTASEALRRAVKFGDLSAS